MLYKYINVFYYFDVFWSSSIYVQIGMSLYFDVVGLSLSQWVSLSFESLSVVVVWVWEFTTFEFMEINDHMHGCYQISFICYDFKLDHVMTPFYQFDSKCCRFNYVHFLVWCSCHPTLQGMVMLISWMNSMKKKVEMRLKYDANPSSSLATNLSYNYLIPSILIQEFPNNNSLNCQGIFHVYWI